MRSLVLKSLPLIALSLGDLPAATTPGREYGFGFEFGNLIRNWSFEGAYDAWFDESWSGTQVSNARFLAKSASIPPVSGSYVARFNGTNSTAAMQYALQSELIPVEPSTQYTFTLYVRSSGNTAGLKPVFKFFRNNGIDSLAPAVGPAYFQNSNAWQSHSFTFTSPAWSTCARLILVQAAPTEGGTLYFDDLVLEKGGVATPRDRISEAVAFTDDRGAALQSHVKIAGGGNTPASRKYLVQTSTFDDLRYPRREYAAYVNSGTLPDYDQGFDAKATAYNNGNNGRGSMGATPYTLATYAQDATGRLSAFNDLGDDWSTMAKASTTGTAFVTDLAIPANPVAPVNPGSDGKYLYSWSKDVEGRVSAQWTNQAGQLIKQASQLGTNWVSQQYEYFPDGKLKKALTPLDDPNNPNAQGFREITHYNTRGEVTSTYSADKGLRKFWYNNSGQIRFASLDEAEPNHFSYTDYDLRFRPISFGEQWPASGASMEVLREEYASTSGLKVEHAGRIYDNLSTFQSRTGVALSSILGSTVPGANGDGRLVCEYMRNDQVSGPILDAARRLVATFYTYNSYGEVTEIHKYIGIAKTPALKVHTAKFTYDASHRLLTESLFDNSPTPQLQGRRKFLYDGLGRVSKILGLNDRFISSYTYFDWGGIQSVILGGNGTASQGTRVEYSYHSHDWVREIKATDQSSGTITFQQFLGYEKPIQDPKATASETHFDGRITHQVVKFTAEAGDPLRLTRYKYDGLGRMTEADALQQSDPAGISGPNQAVNWSQVNFAQEWNRDSRYQYDANGRIIANQGGSFQENAIYNYNPSSYTLNSVAGGLGRFNARDASLPGTFQYDSRGRMVKDGSKRLTLNYAWNDMPTDITVVDENGNPKTEHQFYDASGMRVGRYRVGFGSFNINQEHVEFIGHWEEGEPAMYSWGASIGGEISRWNYICASGCTANKVTLYYVPDRGMTSTDGSMDAVMNIAPIQRPNGPPIPIEVIGLIKDSPRYVEVIQQFMTGANQSIVLDVGILGEGDKHVVEDLPINPNDPAVLHTSVGILGASGSQIGRISGSGWYEFYLKNHQGSIMRSVNDDGSYSAGSSFDYLAYGDPEQTIANPDGVVPGYTGKEHDKDFSRLTYFGARWYDPELALWLSVDPAAQFFDPYSYGGDPLNFMDPNGLWSLGIGLVVGWDKKHGWNWGFGVAGDMGSGDYTGSLNISYVWNEDGSRTKSLGGTGNVNLMGWNMYIGGSYTNNTMDGTVVSAMTGGNYMGFGGGEGGGSFYWDREGNYRGATAYKEFYGGAFGFKTGTGYEWGFGGMKGRGWFQEASGYGFSASYAEHGGFNYGFSGKVASYSITNEKPQILNTNTDDKFDLGHSAITDGTIMNQDLVSIGPNDPDGSNKDLMFETSKIDWATYKNTDGTKKQGIFGRKFAINNFSNQLKSFGSGKLPYSLLLASCSTYAGLAIMSSTGAILPGLVTPTTLQWNMMLHQGKYVGNTPY